MERYLLWTIFAICIFGSDCSKKIVCPKYCSCDLYENLNRADCSDKKLISPNIEIPGTVEILDLSYNDISSLEDRCFKGLGYLRNLTLSNNAIHTIFLDAFLDLIDLEHIDLSNNRLEAFDSRIFETNAKLISVNLNGNKFMSLPDQPFIISPSIQMLSLHNSQIMQTTPLQFTKMPLLVELDLSDNPMITLNVATFMRMGRLKRLNVVGNMWTTCHSDLKSTVDYLRSKKVELRINVCNLKSEKKFERMMLTPPNENATIEPTETDMTDIWKNITVMNGTTSLACELENLPAICQLYETCNLKLSRMQASQSTNNVRLKLLDQNERVYVALYSGLFLGFFVTSSIVYVMYLICGSRYWRKRRLQRKLAERRRNFPAWVNTVRLPVPIPRELHPTRRPLPRQPATRHAINRANQREFLLARLFERPERHRQLNRNLINRTQSVRRNQDTERLIRPSPPEENLSPIDEAVRDIAIMRDGLQQLLGESQTVAADTVPEVTITPPEPEPSEPEPPRSETPPPAYSEIVKN